MNLDLCMCDECKYNPICNHAYHVGSCPFKASNRDNPEYERFFKDIELFEKKGI